MPQRARRDLAHADDAAAADGDAGLADARDRVEALVIRPCRDDAAVELGRACRGCGCTPSSRRPRARRPVPASACRACSTLPCRARGRPAPSSSTRSNSSPSATSRHAAPMQNRVAPCSRALRAAASASSTLSEIVAIGVRPIVRRLRAIRAVLGTSAALDVQQHAALHFVRPVMVAVNELRAQQQVEQRGGVDRFDLGDGPVVAGFRHRDSVFYSPPRGR